MLTACFRGSVGDGVKQNYLELLPPQATLLPALHRHPRKCARLPLPPHSCFWQLLPPSASAKWQRVQQEEVIVGRNLKKEEAAMGELLRKSRGGWLGGKLAQRPKSGGVRGTN